MTKSKNIGTFKKVVPTKLTELQKGYFWNKVAITANDEKCWEWTGSLARKHYGLLRLNGKLFRSHRISYLIYTGVDPNQLCVLHSCDNPKCVNPKHLSLGTHGNNMEDMVLKGRAGSLRGIDNPHSKLTEQQALDIKSEYNLRTLSTYKIAKKYNVSQGTVCAIGAGRLWKHLNN